MSGIPPCDRCRRPALNQALGHSKIEVTDFFGTREQAWICPVCIRDLLPFFPPDVQKRWKGTVDPDIIRAYLDIWPWPS